MSHFLESLRQSNVDSCQIIVMLIGGLIGFARRRSVHGATVAALNASALVPAMLMVLTAFWPQAAKLLSPMMFGISGYILLIFVLSEFARGASDLDTSGLRRRSANISRPFASLFASLALAAIDIVIYLGWFHRLVEFNSLPAAQQQRLERVRDHRLAPVLRVIFLLILLTLFITLTAGALFGHSSQSPK